MEINDLGLGIMVVVLGSLLVIAGIALLVVLLKEGRWWGNLMMMMVGMDLPDFGKGALVPMVQQGVRGMLERLSLYIRIGALISGAGVSIIGLVLIVIGIYIWS